MTETKPLMSQYQAIKQEYSDAILLFQMGDFFECFYDDAQKVSDALGLVLTSRSKNDDAPPMAGFPQKALDEYLPKLISAGYKVAVARQIENPKNVKGIVRRAVTEVITQGTIATQEELLSRDKNYLMSVIIEKGVVGLAFADISTGEFKIYEDRYSDEHLRELIERLSPRELLKSTKDTALELTDAQREALVIQPIDDKLFSYEVTKSTLLNHFSVPNLDALGLQDMPLATIAAGVLLAYITDTKKGDPKHITKLTPFHPNQALHIDPTSQRNLEIFYNLKTHRTEGSLIGILDSTKTALGHRLLYEWLAFPETHQDTIEKRYDAVAFLTSHSAVYQEITEKLHRFPDTQRLTSALGLNRIHHRHLDVLAQAVTTGISVAALLEKHSDELSLFPTLSADRHTQLSSFASSIFTAFYGSATPTPSSDTTARPTFFAPGFNAELDRLVNLATNGEQYIKDLYNKEKVTHNLPALKLTFNNAFGYAFELSRAKSDTVPEHFIKKQTLVNAERYITEELKNLETQVLSARDQLNILEGELYSQLLTSLHPAISALNELSTLIATLDVITAFATNALTYRYTRPTLTTDQRTLVLEGMRHPVVERTVKEFVPNTLEIEKQQNFLILTGPNMGGKSTFVRQIALLHIMAQIGSFVPASKAVIPIVDQVFARIGASDDISTGKSTFMVELSEVAYIVAQATDKSLIILDEVGRGTSTYEGISLAWGIAQYVAHRIGATTIFTTHFRELTELESQSNKFINYKVNLKEQNNTIYFLHTVTRGKSDKSYGIQVARLVNLPDEIIDTAFTVLNSFEQQAPPVAPPKNTLQMDLFSTPNAALEQKITELEERVEKYQKIEALLKDVDPNNMTPMEALRLIELIQEQ